jgi:peptidoglycan/xylan/chitin deacetylase (PgdA/CDA1 family)
LLGRCAQRHPDLVARIAAGGHAIGNHSWDHPSFPAVSTYERRRQISACGRVLGRLAPKLFRPPYGDQTLGSRLDALWLGYQVVTWNVSGTDWRGDGPEAIADRVLHDLRPGSIVLLHDALYRYEDPHFVSRAATLAALAIVLQAAAGRFRFVTVPQLLTLGRPNREFWIQPGQADYVAGLKSGGT